VILSASAEEVEQQVEGHR